MTDRLAVLADIHGNAWALEAVLADARAQRCTSLVNLGDVFHGPLDPGRTARLLEAADADAAPTVGGNEDRALVDAQTLAHDTIAQHARAALSTGWLSWLRELPVSRTLDNGIALCHGTPERDDVYLLERVADDRLEPRPADQIAADLARIDARVVLCAHSHLPRRVDLDDGRIVVNPGSVGVPAYRARRPQPHTVSSGDPRARYAILTGTPEGWDLELRAVPYDVAAAQAAAAKAGFPDWQNYLSAEL